MNFARLQGVGCLLVIQAWLGLSASAAMALNDNFADAEVLTGFPVTAEGNNLNATAEPNEPAAGLPPQQSIWWQWTAPFTGRIGVIEGDGSVVSAWIKIFTGHQLTSLTNLGSVGLHGMGVTVLNVTAGTTYQFAVDINSSPETGGPVQFRLIPLPTNDNFAAAISLTNEMVEYYGDNSLATLEEGEPDYSSGWQGASIWWTWTAPRTGSVRISTTGSSFSPWVHVFTGDSLTNLTFVTQSPEDVMLDAVAGTTYRIRIVGGFTIGWGKVRLVVYPRHPLNDDFAARTPLAKTVTQSFGTTAGATAQALDPVLYFNKAGNTVWYSWQAPTSGWLRVTAANHSGHPLIPRFRVGIFSGSQLGRLARLAGAMDSAAALVNSGQTYTLAVDGDTGDFRLLLDFQSRPANDNFTNRFILSGPTASVTNENFGATLELGEPTPARGMASASIWYQWTAPAGGAARFYAQGEGFMPVVALYRGDALWRLKRVVSSLSQKGNPVVCSLTVKAGDTYVMAVDGRYPGGRGNILAGVDLTTLQITNPVSGTAISATALPLFAVNEPQPSVDGILQSVTYHAVQTNGAVSMVGVSTVAPFSVAPTNLPVGKITLFAIGSNTLGAARVTPPVPVKVRPLNDNFDQAQPLEGYQWNALGYTSQATRERGEPNNGAATVWWKWTAPATGLLEIQAQLGEFGSAMRNRRFAVYAGPAVGQLQPVRWNSTMDQPFGSKFFRLKTTNGVTYHFVVGASTADLDQGVWPLHLTARLDSLQFSEPTNSVFHEPANVPVGISTSEEPAAIQRVDFLASDGYTNGQLIASVTEPPYRLIWSNAPPGDYSMEARIMKQAGPSPLSGFRQFSVRPINDDFSNRIILATNFAWMAHRIAGASREPGEPVHHGNGYARSAWWSWTAPSSGKFYLSSPPGVTGDSSADVAVYTGTNLSSLIPVSTATDSVYGSSLVATVTSNTAYQFAVIPGSTPEVKKHLRFYPPPLNDSFSNRIVVIGSRILFTGHTVGATREPNEPHHAGFTEDHTIWWSWTAPDNGAVTLRQTNGLWLIAGVYTGDSPASLQVVRSTGSLYTPVNFEVVSNTTYQIAVLSYWGDEEQVGVDLEYTARTANDSFAGRTWVEGTNLTLSADNRGATIETGEPPLAAGGTGRTLWWSWTAPANGMAYLKTMMMNGSPLLEVFQGESLPALTPPLMTGGHLWFRAISNETYHVRFDSTQPVTDSISIALDLVPAPANDEFANATVLSETNIDINATTRGAAHDSGSPPIGNDMQKSVWYTWTAPGSSQVLVALADNADDHCALRLFTGNSISNLVTVGTNRSFDAVLLEAQAGTTYHFAVAGPWYWEPDFPTSGDFRLLLMPGNAPANDDFANAEQLAGSSAIITATNWLATLEPKDPEAVKWFHLQRTLWYQWRAPASGLLLLTNTGSTVNPRVMTYLGTNPSQLYLIGDVETSVRSNEVVSILLDGDGGVGGVLRLGLSFLPAPGNDDFEAAMRMTGSPCALQGDAYTATGQSTNPNGRQHYAYRDIWWQWTAPAAGMVTITNLQADTNPSVSIRTGTTFSNLSLLAWLPWDARSLEFEVTAGGVYYVQASRSSYVSFIDLRLQMNEAPASTSSARLPESATVATGTLPKPQILSPRMQADGRFAFRLQGASGTPYQIECSNDLINWQVLRTGVMESDGEEFVDPDDGQAEARFYRLRH
jgi:hypothetical protein